MTKSKRGRWAIFEKGLEEYKATMSNGWWSNILPDTPLITAPTRKQKRRAALDECLKKLEQTEITRRNEQKLKPQKNTALAGQSTTPKVKSPSKKIKSVAAKPPGKGPSEVTLKEGKDLPAKAQNLTDTRKPIERQKKNENELTKQQKNKETAQKSKKESKTSSKDENKKPEIAKIKPIMEQKGDGNEGKPTVNQLKNIEGETISKGGKKKNITNEKVEKIGKVETKLVEKEIQATDNDKQQAQPSRKDEPQQKKGVSQQDQSSNKSQTVPLPAEMKSPPPPLKEATSFPQSPKGTKKGKDITKSNQSSVPKPTQDIKTPSEKANIELLQPITTENQMKKNDIPELMRPEAGPTIAKPDTIKKTEAKDKKVEVKQDIPIVAPSIPSCQKEDTKDITGVAKKENISSDIKGQVKDQPIDSNKPAIMSEKVLPTKESAQENSGGNLEKMVAKNIKKETDLTKKNETNKLDKNIPDPGNKGALPELDAKIPDKSTEVEKSSLVAELIEPKVDPKLPGSKKKPSITQNKNPESRISETIVQQLDAPSTEINKPTDDINISLSQKNENAKNTPLITKPDANLLCDSKKLPNITMKILEKSSIAEKVDINIASPCDQLENIPKLDKQEQTTSEKHIITEQAAIKVTKDHQKSTLSEKRQRRKTKSGEKETVPEIKDASKIVEKVFTQEREMSKVSAAIPPQESHPKIPATCPAQDKEMPKLQTVILQQETLPKLPATVQGKEMPKIPAAIPPQENQPKLPATIPSQDKEMQKVPTKPLPKNKDPAQQSPKQKEILKPTADAPIQDKNVPEMASKPGPLPETMKTDKLSKKSQMPAVEIPKAEVPSVEKPVPQPQTLPPMKDEPEDKPEQIKEQPKVATEPLVLDKKEVKPTSETSANASVSKPSSKGPQEKEMSKLSTGILQEKTPMSSTETPLPTKYVPKTTPKDKLVMKSGAKADFPEKGVSQLPPQKGEGTKPAGKSCQQNKEDHKPAASIHALGKELPKHSIESMPVCNKDSKSEPNTPQTGAQNKTKESKTQKQEKSQIKAGEDKKQSMRNTVTDKTQTKTNSSKIDAKTKIPKQQKGQATKPEDKKPIESNDSQKIDAKSAKPTDKTGNLEKLPTKQTSDKKVQSIEKPYESSSSLGDNNPVAQISEKGPAIDKTNTAKLQQKGKRVRQRSKRDSESEKEKEIHSQSKCDTNLASKQPVEIITPLASLTDNKAVSQGKSDNVQKNETVKPHKDKVADTTKKQVQEIKSPKVVVPQPKKNESDTLKASELKGFPEKSPHSISNKQSQTTEGSPILSGAQFPSHMLTHTPSGLNTEPLVMPMRQGSSTISASSPSFKPSGQGMMSTPPSSQHPFVTPISPPITGQAIPPQYQQGPNTTQYCHGSNTGHYPQGQNVGQYQQAQNTPQYQQGANTMPMTFQRGISPSTQFTPGQGLPSYFQSGQSGQQQFAPQRFGQPPAMGRSHQHGPGISPNTAQQTTFLTQADTDDDIQVPGLFDNFM